jgi:hypothetical protein
MARSSTITNTSPIGQTKLGLEEKMSDPKIEEVRANVALLRKYKAMVAAGQDQAKLHELEHDLQARGVDPFAPETVAKPVPVKAAPKGRQAPTKSTAAPAKKDKA